jgi:rhamnogalacturonan endolyase
MKEESMRYLLLLTFAFLLPAQERFVLVQGGAMPGRPELRVDDFEMADAPVTNAQYLEFIQATKHAPPLHWEQGRIPAGFENHPVIYVNRYDVEDYLAWRTRKEKRIYRLPTSVEFEYAARAGSREALYPWGSEAPQGRANFDENGTRPFPDWKQYLKPVRSYAPNPWKLYDLAGNVWQMLWSNSDPELQRYIFRIERPVQKESSVAGGSWARTAPYLRVTSRGGAGGAGIRHPDLGFRLVREPAGSTHFRSQLRRVATLPQGERGVYLSWQLLAGDGAGTGFYVYRSPRRDASGVRITPSPVMDITTYIDAHPPAAARLYYRVRAVTNGVEGPPSEWAAVAPNAPASNVAAVFEPTPKEGTCTPNFADLDGDGVLDMVLRCDNGIKENTRDPGRPVEIEALTSYGRQLWRRPLIDFEHCYGNANNAPVAVADLNGDGRAEVLARIQEGDTVFLAVLDGMNGRTLRKTPWPAMATDFAGTSTRIHMAVASLDGKTLSIITQTGLYENERFHTWDASLRPLWHYDSFGATSGSGSHHIDVADVDDDGRDEIFDGTTLLGPDGTLRWSLFRLHPDIVAVKHVLPNTRERQVYYAVESSTHAGAYLADARTGKVIWKINREDDPRWTHAHIGWAADILASSPGLEMLTNRDGHDAKDTVLLSSDGKILMNPFTSAYRPVNWTGGAVRELLSGDARQLMRFTGTGLEPAGAAAPSEKACRVIMTGDLWGDYRDEVVCSTEIAPGRNAIVVLTNTDAAARREITRTASHEYQMWLAKNLTAGYGSYFEWQPGH